MSDPARRMVSVVPAITLLVITLLPGCATGMRRAELLTRLAGDDPPLVIDVRSAAEYRAGHLPGAVHFPYAELRSRAADLRRAAGTRPLVVYCAHGPRAGLAGMTLRSAGFEAVYSLNGHMSAWRRHGLPVELTPNALPDSR